MNISRREFLLGAAAFAAMPQLAAYGELAAKGRVYSVPILGDIHFDSPDPKFYHADYTHSTSKKRYEAHLAEHVRNAEMWKERLPRLVRASGACVRKDAAFALQVGDLVQGDCGNAATSMTSAPVRSAHGRRRFLKSPPTRAPATAVATSRSFATSSPPSTGTTNRSCPVRSSRRSRATSWASPARRVGSPARRRLWLSNDKQQHNLPNTET